MNPTKPVTSERVKTLRNRIWIALQMAEISLFGFTPEFENDLLAIADKDGGNQFAAFHDVAKRVEQGFAEALIAGINKHAPKDRIDMTRKAMATVERLSGDLKLPFDSPWHEKFATEQETLRRLLREATNDFAQANREQGKNSIAMGRYQNAAITKVNLTRDCIRKACQNMLTGGPDE